VVETERAAACSRHDPVLLCKTSAAITGYVVDVYCGLGIT
jgi:hypothetical protein